MSKECPKCGYVRTAEEFAPEWQCPKCQIVYAKYKPKDQSIPDFPPEPHMGEPLQNTHSGGRNLSVSKLLLKLVVIIAAGYFIYSGYFDFGYRRHDEVVVFTSSDCVPCRSLFNLLKTYGVEYTVYDIYESDENMKLFEKDGKDTLPLLLVGRYKVEGFDEGRTAIALGDRLEDPTDADGNVLVVMYSTST